MAVNLNAGEEKLIPTEGYTDDIKPDGNKVFSCKQCNKEIKTEQGIKAHIKNKHKNQSVKRTIPLDTEDKNLDAEENKKQKLGSMINEQDVSDFEFDHFNMETSSQIGGSEHLDATSDICAEYLQDNFDVKELGDHEVTVDRIVASRATSNTNLINLDDTLSADQDHNYLIEDDYTENMSEALCAARATSASLKSDVILLTEENRKLKDLITIKDETNNALTASNNSLNDVKTQLEAKIKNLETIKSKYESRLNTYGATIKEMDGEVKRLKVGRVAATDKLDHNDKLKQAQDLVTEKQKEIKSLQNTIKKKDVVEKELQLTINRKNARISELEVGNSRQQMKFDHAIEISEKQLKAGDRTEKSKNKETLGDTPKAPAKKCFYENNGNCRDQEKCLYYHPKKTCQSHSKLGSCPQESLCEHRHPQKVCPRLQTTGYCSSGDRCRSRHPLEYAFNDYSQSTSRRKSNKYNNNFNYHFLGSSPHTLQGPGMDQTYPAPRASHSSAPREPWSPPFQTGVVQGGPPLHPPFSQGRVDHHQLW